MCSRLRPRSAPTILPRPLQLCYARAPPRQGPAPSQKRPALPGLTMLEAPPLDCKTAHVRQFWIPICACAFLYSSPRACHRAGRAARAAHPSSVPVRTHGSAPAPFGAREAESARRWRRRSSPSRSRYGAGARRGAVRAAGAAGRVRRTRKRGFRERRRRRRAPRARAAGRRGPGGPEGDRPARPAGSRARRPSGRLHRGGGARPRRVSAPAGARAGWQGPASRGALRLRGGGRGTVGPVASLCLPRGRASGRMASLRGAARGSGTRPQRLPPPSPLPPGRRFRCPSSRCGKRSSHAPTVGASLRPQSRPTLFLRVSDAPGTCRKPKRRPLCF